MANPYFAFKQFTVYHDRCAMKVGTDGVLLGAWVNLAGASRILDVGTGTGLIALMMAQRSEAAVHGVEMDEYAFLQAIENVNRSPWSDRITLFHNTFQQFARESKESYDLIVSNPPYFRNSLKPPARGRSLARHDGNLSYEVLLFCSSKLLNAEGKLSIILPAGERLNIQRIAEFHDLHVTRETLVKPRVGADFKRILVEFSKMNVHSYVSTELAIKSQNNMMFTKEYYGMVKEYYLKMI